MVPFTTQRITCTASMRLVAPPATVFPLFEPPGEKRWVTDWNPTVIYPQTGNAEVGTVFSTRAASGPPTIWTIAQFDPDHFEITYLRVAPDSHVAIITIQCAAEGNAATSARVTYTFTGLTSAGNSYIATYTEAYYRAWIAHWEGET